MVNTILVPLDGSKRAEKILPHVESLARTCAARVIFLGIVEPLFIAHQSVYNNPLFDQQNIEQQTADMDAYLAALQQTFRQKGIEADRSVGHNLVVEGIIATAQREKADLIALCSHGRTGLARVFYGSVAAGILHRIDRPLLLIRSLDETPL